VQGIARKGLTGWHLGHALPFWRGEGNLFCGFAGCCSEIRGYEYPSKVVLRKVCTNPGKKSGWVDEMIEKVSRYVKASYGYARRWFQWVVPEYLHK
jgi:hypothetical protein